MSGSETPAPRIGGRGRSFIGLIAGCAVLLAAGVGATLGGSGPTNGPIAFIRFIEDEAHLIAIQPDGSGEHEIALPTQGFLPNWSPDGRRLVVTVFTDDTLRPMLVDPVHGTTSRLEVPDAPRDLALLCRTWTPDGKRLLCNGDSFSGEHSELNAVYSIRTNGSQLRRLTWGAFPRVVGEEGECGGGDMPGGASPDGEWFVFTRTRCGTLPAPDLDQTAALFVTRTDGSRPRQITRYGLPWSHEEGIARWSPDGSQILFATADGKLVTIRPDGSHRKTVKLDSPGDSPFAIAPDWSPDGKRIVFNLFLENGISGLHVADADGSDVMLLAPHGADFVNTPDWGAVVR